MELTEICGNIRLYFNDHTFGLPVCSVAEHTALLDSLSEFEFETMREQYYQQMKAAMSLQDAGAPFELHFSVAGNALSDPSSCEAKGLYYCHVQSWGNRVGIDLFLPEKKEIISAESCASLRNTQKAIDFAFGGFLYTCWDFRSSAINLKDPDISQAIELYCLTSDKQMLLNELLLPV